MTKFVCVRFCVCVCDVSPPKMKNNTMLHKGEALSTTCGAEFLLQMRVRIRCNTASVQVTFNS